MPDANPLIDDRDVAFLLYEVHDAEGLCALDAFADHSRETFDLTLRSVRRLARDVLYPAYKPMDEDPARLADGAITTHPAMRAIYPQLVELGLISATRPESVGGQDLPHTVHALVTAYLMAANPSAYGYIGLTTGAAHLIEAFGDDALRRDMMAPMYAGEWTGTMALTEPHAGSSLADVQTVARPDGDHYRIRGSKIFISGGDHDLADNIVHMTLARIEGAPAGIKGVSLFAVPKRRRDPDGALIANDVHVAGAIHKIGWRGLPSLVMSYGEDDDCHGWLVGEPHRGIHYMFQMMNEARLMVGLNGAATASVAYHEALAYARERPQGRPPGIKDPSTPQVPIIDHADVRRMLLRQKAIVDGALSLLTATARQADLAAHGPDDDARRRAGLLLDLLTPIAKTFPAEAGFEANALAVQVHGGYGYSSEYLPESWLRDQKLNSIHEGTTGIQGLDLLGRKAMAQGGAAVRLLGAEIAATAARAREAGVDSAWCDAVVAAFDRAGAVTAELGARGMRGDVDAMLAHSADYLTMMSIVAIGWQWLAQAAAAMAGLARGGAGEHEAFYRGKLCAAQYWIRTELPRVDHLARLCVDGEDSYLRMQPEWF